jgi:hypothetical protein
MPRRLSFDSLKDTFRGIGRPKQKRPALDTDFVTGTTNDNTSSPNSDPAPKLAQVDLTSTLTPTEADPDSDNAVNRNNSATQRTVSVLEVIPESSQELSQSTHMKLFYPKRMDSSSSASDSKGAQLPPHYLENLKNKEFSVLIQDLRTRLIRAGGHHTQHYLDITSALEEKYNVLQHEKYSALLQLQDGRHEADSEDE